MKRQFVSLFKTFVLVLTLIVITVYLLFVSSVIQVLDSSSQHLQQVNVTPFVEQPLSSLEQASADLLFISTLFKSDEQLLVKKYSSINATSVESIVTLHSILRQAFIKMLYPLMVLILFGVLIFILASRYYQRKANLMLNNLSKKAENSVSLLCENNYPYTNESHSSSMRLNLALDKLFSKIQSFSAQSEISVYRDKLTKLTNRHKFLDHINAVIKNEDHDHKKSALLFIDLDGFKQANDSFGHSFGDEVLIQVAERLKSIIRAENLCHADIDAPLEYNLARLGGDEFTMFIEDLKNSEQTIMIAKRVLKELEKDFVLGNKLIKISASVGIAVYPDSASSPDALVQMADVAMYRAKNDGRGIHRIYSPEMGSSLRRYHYLLEEMRLGLETDSFFLSFQPIINVDGSTISYFEALVRWQHPVEGTITPTEFIPIAEDSNLILKLGDWILLEACRQMAAWYNAGMRKTRISINISGIQLKHKPIYEWVTSALEKTGLPASSLMLEITESCFIDISEQVVDGLNKLREQGVVIAIDDFGTGFSSLSVLANLPVDVLKIDRLFIAESTKNKKYHKILQSIAELSQKLELKVVAEGIEHIEQLELLKSLGVVYIQGYLISRPESSANVGSKVLSQSANHLSMTGTGVWPPQTSRMINQVAN